MLRRSGTWPLFLGCAFLLLVALTNIRNPLAGVHWDSPIWLYQGKGFAETHYLESLARCARTSAEHTDVPYCFYAYSRLGHIAILGWIVELFGSTSSAIRVASSIYYLLLTLGVGLAGLSAVRIQCALSGPPGDSIDVGRGALVSALLYVSSELFSYLGNSLVSDVPSLALVSLFSFFLINGLSNRSHRYLIFSGISGFLAYVVRVESVWACVSLLLALAAVFGLRKGRRIWWFGLICAATYLIVPLAIYAAVLHPLGDPFTYLKWARKVNQHWSATANVDAGWIGFARAGAMLWLGLLICAARRKLPTAAAVGLIWLLLLSVPWLPWFFASGATQTRHYSLVALPLMYVSSIGWAEVLERQPLDRPWRRVCTVSLMIALAFNLTIRQYPSRFLGSIPGFWRLDGISGLKALQPPLREQGTYWIDEAFDLGREVYRADLRTVVLRSEALPAEDFVYLIAFAGSAYRSSADFLKTVSGPEDFVECDEAASRLKSASVVYVTRATPECRAHLHAQGIRLLQLVHSSEEDVLASLHPGSSALVLTTPHFRVYRLD